MVDQESINIQGPAGVHDGARYQGVLPVFVVPGASNQGEGIAVVNRAGSHPTTEAQMVSNEWDRGEDTR